MMATMPATRRRLHLLGSHLGMHSTAGHAGAVVQAAPTAETHKQFVVAALPKGSLTQIYN